MTSEISVGNLVLRVNMVFQIVRFIRLRNVFQCCANGDVFRLVRYDRVREFIIAFRR